MDTDTWTGGEALYRARKARGLTQSKAAQIFGVEPGAYGAWERGETAPRADKRVKMVEEFGLEPDAVGLPVPSNMSLIGSRHFDQRLDAIDARLERIETLAKRAAR